MNNNLSIINKDIVNNNNQIKLKTDYEIDCVIEYEIEFREIDCFINVLKICAKYNKKIDDWLKLDSSVELICELENETKISYFQLIDIKKNNFNDILEHIWMHPDLAIQFIYWIDKNLYLQINKFIRKKMSLIPIDYNIKILKEKDEIIKKHESRIKYLENLTLKRHSRIIFQGTNTVYLITCKELKEKRKYIIGKTINLTERLSSYDKSSDYEVICYKSFETEAQMSLAESMILEKLDKYREQANRERVILPPCENVNIFIEVFEKTFSYFIENSSKETNC